MRVSILSGGGVVGPMELGPVDTETIDSDLGKRIETLARKAFSDVSASDSPELPHPNEPWTDVMVVDRVPAGRLPGNAAQDLSDLLGLAGEEWHRTGHPTAASPIFRHWVHSHEEDADGVRVYRSRDFAFPPSRGREGLELHASGAVVGHHIGPGDAPVETPGHWTVGRLQVDFDGQRGTTVLDIVSYDEEVLRVREVPDGE